MRYRAQLRPSLFIFTGRVTRQQIVFFISLFISSSNSPPSIPLANQPLLISLRCVFERANSARVVHFALAWNGRRSNSLLRSKRTMRRVHRRNCTLGRPPRSGILTEDCVSRGQSWLGGKIGSSSHSITETRPRRNLINHLATH